MGDPIQREMLSAMKSMKRSLDQANEELRFIKRQHTELTADVALLLKDPKVTEVLHTDTVEELRVRHSKRSDPVFARVLATTELIEAILLCLPMHDILFAQAVCTRFKDVIAGSLALQRALFFEPEDVIPCAEGDQPVLPLINPLLMGKRTTRSMLALQSNLRPEMIALYLQHGGSPRLVNTNDPNTFRTFPRVHFSRTDIVRCFLIGSWRRMFLTQPPSPCVLCCNNTLSITRISGTKRLGELWQPHWYGSGEPEERQVNDSQMHNVPMLA